MNITLVVLMVEVTVVLLGIVGFLFFLRWKGNKGKTAEVEKLLDNVDSHKEERKSQLAEYLINSYSLETEKAKETSEFMVEAEKLFLQQFLKQQIEQTQVTDFYQNLCELLDQYLYFIPTVNSEKDSLNEEIRVEQNSADLQNNEVTDSEKIDSENTNATTEPEEVETSEGEPDKGDAFVESGDEIDEETSAGYDTEVKKD